MHLGELVLLRDSISPTYGREGETGIVIETEILTSRNGYPSAEFSRVLWSDGKATLYKTEHLEVVS